MMTGMMNFSNRSVDVDPDLECPQCHALMLDPTQTPCGHIFCRKCLDDVISSTHLPYCPAGEDGCQDVVLTVANIHLDNNTLAKMRRMEMKCSSLGCSRMVNMSELPSHQQRYHSLVSNSTNNLHNSNRDQRSTIQKSSAPLISRRGYNSGSINTSVIVFCQYCNKETTSAKLKEHHQVCEECLVSCPNNCHLTTGLRRRENNDCVTWNFIYKYLSGIELNEHLLICTERPLECEYAHIGCNFKGSRAALDEHNNSHRVLVSHNSLLLKEVQSKNKSMEAMANSLKEVDLNIERLQSTMRYLETEMQDNKTIAKEQKDLGKRLQLSSVESMERYNTIARKLDSHNTILKEKALLTDVVTVNKELKAVSKVAHQAKSKGDKQDGHTLTLLAARLSTAEDTLSKQRNTLDMLKKCTYDGVFTWKIDSYAKRKQDSIIGEPSSIYSTTFYVGRYGYKMRARVYLNGDGKARGSHLSFFITIMRGEFDNILKWPYAQKTTLMLLDQSGNKSHVVETFKPNGATDCFKKPLTSMNLSAGSIFFIPHSKLESSRSGYIQDDAIFVKVIVDKSGLRD